MKKIIKYIGIALSSLIIIAIILLVIAMKFSGKEIYLACTGEFSYENIVEKNKTIYLELVEYRKFVKLWNKSSDGDLRVDFDPFGNYYNKIKLDGNSVLIYRNDNLLGEFSKLTKSIILVDELESFKGKCREIDKI